MNFNFCPTRRKVKKKKSDLYSGWGSGPLQETEYDIFPKFKQF